MESTEILKKRLIERILETDNNSLLEAIEKLFISIQTKKHISLSNEQKEMLAMSEEDIKHNRIISEKELDRSDKQWLM